MSSLPIGGGLRCSTEIEIVAPDHADGRGAAWPWALTALSYRAQNGWEIAGAVEASSTVLQRYEVDALLRVARTFEVR